MDLLKEIRELRDAIVDALEDGQIRPIEWLRIARELVDVLLVVLPVIIGAVTTVSREQAAASGESGQ